MPTLASQAIDPTTRPVRRKAARAFFFSGMLLGALAVTNLSGCSSLESVMLIEAPDEGWQTLPVDDLLSRESITITNLVFCRRSQCGDDSAVGSFIVTGQEAARLEAALDNPDLLKGIIDRSKPAVATPRAGKPPSTTPPPRASVVVQPLRHEGWRGALVSIEGGTRQRHAYGVIYARRHKGKLTAVLAVSDKRMTAERLAIEAMN